MRTSLLDPMPDVELLGHTLDLGRGELAALMHRYSSPPPRRQPAAQDPPSALIVTRLPEQELSLREVLEDDVWFVKTCTGPGTGDCPLLRGKRCPLRESADAAVVFVDPEEIGRIGISPRLRCAADSASPAIVVLEKRIDAPREVGRTATIGAVRGPVAIVASLKRLLQRAS